MSKLKSAGFFSFTLLMPQALKTRIVLVNMQLKQLVCRISNRKHDSKFLRQDLVDKLNESQLQCRWLHISVLQNVYKYLSLWIVFSLRRQSLQSVVNLRHPMELPLFYKLNSNFTCTSNYIEKVHSTPLYSLYNEYPHPASSVLKHEKIQLFIFFINLYFTVLLPFIEQSDHFHKAAITLVDFLHSTIGLNRENLKRFLTLMGICGCPCQNKLVASSWATNKKKSPSCKIEEPGREATGCHFHHLNIYRQQVTLSHCLKCVLIMKYVTGPVP